MNINYFENATTKVPSIKTFDDLVSMLRTDEVLRMQTGQYRAALAGDDPKAGKMKRAFGAFLPASLVTGTRKRENVTALTGLVMCDFDHVPADRLAEVRRKANEDPHTVLSYVTLSGGGLRVLAAYEVPELKNEKEPEKFPIAQYEKYYRDMFAIINEHYSRLLGLTFDPACKDLSRLSFIAYDAEAFYRTEAQTFDSSMASAKEKERKKEKKEHAARNKRLHQIDRVFQYRIQPSLKANGAAFAPGRHNDYVMRVGYQMNQYGFELEDVQAWALKEFSDYPEACQVIQSCYNKTEEHGKWADMLTKSLTTDNGKLPRATRTDIIEFLKEKVEIRYNVVLGTTEMRWINPPYNGIPSQLSRDRRTFTQHLDAMVGSLLCLMETERGLDASAEKMYQYINSDLVPDYDPLYTYMHSLPQWDPDKDPDYILELADSVHVIDEDPNAQDLFTRCLKKWLVAMLAGWSDIEVTNQTILIFIGKQGTFKSTWMQHLMPPVLKEYFKTKQNSGEMTKEDLIDMSNYGMILHEEMDALTMRENNILKAMTTTKHSDERAAYARTKKRRDNIASLCGTGNNEHFLSDEGGTRRSLAFRVEVVKSPIQHPFNYEGIYSQAFALLKDPDFRYYFGPQEQQELEEHNRQFVIASSEESAVMLYVRKPTQTDTPRWLPASAVADELARRTRNYHYDANKIGRILSRFGYEKRIYQGQAGYKVMIRDFDDAERYQKQLAIDPKEEEEEANVHVIADPDEQPEAVQTFFHGMYGDEDDDDEREIDYSNNDD